STSRWRSFAAWYSAFSRKSPSSRARLISRGSSVFNSLSSCAISSSNFFRIRCFTLEMLAERRRRRRPGMNGRGSRIIGSVERISSRQNAIVKRFRDLARAARSEGSAGHGEHASRAGHAAEVLLDGEHLVQEALHCDIPVEIAAFSDKQLAN